MKLTINYLRQFGSSKRSEIEKLLLDILPHRFSPEQKKNKVKNLLQELRKQGLIEIEGREWKTSKTAR